jgi:hypothetical protein
MAAVFMAECWTLVKIKNRPLCPVRDKTSPPKDRRRNIATFWDKTSPAETSPQMKKFNKMLIRKKQQKFIPPRQMATS